MLLFDVNVLVYAYREDTEDHDQYRSWLESEINSDRAYGVSELVLSGFLRIVTHPRIFRTPSPLRDALGFVQSIRDRDNCMVLAPGETHWRIFTNLCEKAGAKGNLIPDAYLAALAIESGSEWITTDRDYARFPELRWHHPLERKP